MSWPTPGGDFRTWGTKLLAILQNSHNADGSIKDAVKNDLVAEIAPLIPAGAKGDKGDPGEGLVELPNSLGVVGGFMFDADTATSTSFGADGKPVPEATALIAGALTDEGYTFGGGGAVDSVNGETGAVVLDADDVGAASFPAQTGNRGKALVTDGTNVSWGAPSASRRVTGTLLDRMDSLIGWAVGGGATAQIVTDADLGEVLEITTDTGVTGTLSRPFLLDLTRDFIGLYIKPMDDNYYYAGASVSLGTSDYASVLTTGIPTGYNPRDVWSQVSMRFTDAGRDDVRGVRLEIFPDTGTSTTVRLALLSRYEPVVPAGVIWAFDDSLADVYTHAYPSLAARDIRGTSAVVTGLVDTAGYATTAQLAEMYDAGWAMVSHTVNHVNLGTASAATIESELDDSLTWLQTQGFTRDIRHLIYPYGGFSTTSHPLVAERFHTARATGAMRSANPQFENFLAIQPAYITAGTSTTQVTNLMDALAADGRGIMYLTFHGIVTSSPTGYQWLQSDLEAVADYANTLGLANYTPAEVWPED